MPTYTYTKLPDYITDQLAGIRGFNFMKNSLRYLAEDILNNPGGNADFLSSFKLDNGATDGGQLIFNASGSPNPTIKCAADGSTFNLNKNLNIVSPHIIIRGYRVWLFYQTPFAFSSSGSLTTQRTTTKLGYRIPTDSSFVSPSLSIISASFGVSIQGFSGSGSCKLEVYKNTSGTPLFGSGTFTVSGNGEQTANMTAAPGTYTLTTSDRIDVYLNLVSGTFNVAPIAWLEIGL